MRLEPIGHRAVANSGMTGSLPLAISIQHEPDGPLPLDTLVAPNL
jgi:hypothetical protein